MKKVNLVIKRIIDILGAVIGLLIFLLPALIIAIAIKKEDNGPILYKQIRVGQNGQQFSMLKFRSMVINAHSMHAVLKKNTQAESVTFKLRRDPRVTKVGSFLRKHSLDEVPQFLNVLVGQMSLVGPRPALPHEVERFSESASQRLNVLPGMTGLWQVNGRSNVPFETMIQMDLHYVEHQSLKLDLDILWKTIIQMIITDDNGAY
ncbi:MAG: sugar transferase [Weissella confusa]|nr:sugar transferase [Weissella confusa]